MSETPGPQGHQAGPEAPSPRPVKRGLKPPERERPADINPRPTRPSPTERLSEMTREHVDSLDRERLRLLDEVDRLRGELDRLLPENARLREALGNGVANGVIASVLITVGGGAIGYAAFAPSAQHTIASAGATSTLAGVVLLVISSIRGNRVRSR